jgi:hypothetical protein
MADDQDRAQRAYEAYAKDTNGVLPGWSDLTADSRQHWQAAVDAIVDTDPAVELEIQGRMADEIARLIETADDLGRALYAVGLYVGRIRYADALRKDRA